MNEITQDQKRIKIAEADGWIEVQPDCTGCRLINRNKWHDVVPDYFNDRNACIGVILKLNPLQREDFIHALVMVVAPTAQWHNLHMPEFYNCITATPGQLCEAIGSTLNLW